MDVTLIPYNPNEKNHNDFLLRLYKVTSERLDDRDRDALIQIRKLMGLVNLENPVHFIVSVEDEWAGFLGGIIDCCDIAWIDGGALPSFRRFYPARRAAFLYCKILFEKWEVKKIKAQIPLDLNRKTMPAEVVLRSLGFRKEGIAKREFLRGGNQLHLLSLALFPGQLKERRRYDKQKTRPTQE